MISNERIRRLMETDREALIEMLAAAYSSGAGHYGYAIRWDPDFWELLGAAQRHSTAPVTTGQGASREGDAA